jgi:hypothetical protein
MPCFFWYVNREEKSCIVVDFKDARPPVKKKYLFFEVIKGL